MNKNEMKTGEVLRKLLAETKTSLKELAQSTSIPSSTLSQLKHGRPARSLSHIRKIANHFGVSVHFLLFGCEDPAATFIRNLEATEIFKGTYEITLKKVSVPSSGGGKK